VLDADVPVAGRRNVLGHGHKLTACKTQDSRLTLARAHIAFMPYLFRHNNLVAAVAVDIGRLELSLVKIAGDLYRSSLRRNDQPGVKEPAASPNVGDRDGLLRCAQQDVFRRTVEG